MKVLAIGGSGGMGRAAVRAAITDFLSGLTVNYRDGGAVQHQDSGGAGGIIRPNPMNGGLV